MPTPLRPHAVRRLPTAVSLALAAVLLVAPGRAAAVIPPALSVAQPPTKPAALLNHGPRNARVVALTFDDGYNPAACGALVDILERTATPATFFPNSVNVVRTPALWRRVAALGFPIGNHTATHPMMPNLTYADQLAQIKTDRSVVEAVIGGPSLLVFRPPYGAYSRGTLAAANEAGYPIVLNWDTSFADSSRRRNGHRWPIGSYVRAASRGTNGSVVLGHCGSLIDLAALPAVIASYRSRGFTFVTIPQLLELPAATAMRFPVGPSFPTAPPLPVGPMPDGPTRVGPLPVGPLPDSPTGGSPTPTASAPWGPASGDIAPLGPPAPGPTPASSSSPGILAGGAERWMSRVRTMPLT